MDKPFIKETYFVMAMDPLHVGTGGYRLGRVDNTIAREPGTNLPKIPGSSIAGVTRAYAAMEVQSGTNFEDPFEKRNGGLYLKRDVLARMTYQRPEYVFEDKDAGKLKSDNGVDPVVKTYYSCAGKGAEDGIGHCGAAGCPVCVAFGFSKKGNSFQGLAQFYDARILLFPIHSMRGPAWVTSPCVLEEHGISADLTDWKKYRPLGGAADSSPLNFGWLYLEADTINNPVNLRALSAVPSEIMSRLCLVSDQVFTRVVNDNLEVRTSVAINPATGAAEDGALFTYEAIPRGTILWFNVVYNKPEFFRINGGTAIEHGKKSGKGYEWIKNNVEKGLDYLETMGVGGMNTRGMGRLRWWKGGKA